MTKHESHTTDHDEIRKWCEARKGKPASVAATGSGDEPGILRINFPGYDEEGLEDISWEDFFEKFDEEDLAFLHQERTQDGGESRFCKFVRREGGKPR